MDILFLSHRIPYPPDKGDKIRAHAIVTHLAAHHRVHIACFIDDPADFQHADTLRRLVKGECLFVPLARKAALCRGFFGSLSGAPITAGYFGSKVITKWIRKLILEFRIERAVVFGSAMAPYLLDQPGIDLDHSILDLVDVDSDKWRQYAATVAWPTNWIYRREAKALGALEREAASRFGTTLLVSPYEAQTFAEIVPQLADRITSVSNGVDLNHFSPQHIFYGPFAEGAPKIVMTGAMDYWPNADGAQWFGREVMPLLLRDFPRAQFYIVGANPTNAVKALQNRYVKIVGSVKDIRPYLAHADVAVAPLRIARGIQNKVLEAMAMGKPVVATWQATRALAVTSGIELWIENDPRRFAAAVAEAISGPKRSTIAQNGRVYVERNHDWANILPAFDHYLEHPARNRSLAGSTGNSAGGEAPVAQNVLQQRMTVGATDPCV